MHVQASRFVGLPSGALYLTGGYVSLDQTIFLQNRAETGGVRRRGHRRKTLWLLLGEAAS